MGASKRVVSPRAALSRLWSVDRITLPLQKWPASAIGPFLRWVRSKWGLHLRRSAGATAG